MVNPLPVDPCDATLVECRDRALQATDVSFVITDAQRPGSPIVWVNEAFTRTTGYRLEDVVGRNPSLLHGPDTDVAEARRMTEAILEGRSTTITVLNYKRDGTPFWNQVSVSPVPDAHGQVTHWVGIQVDVTEQVEHAESQARSIATERRARSGLALVAHVSELLAEVEEPYVLREIAAVLQQDVVGWAQFLLADGILRPASGIDDGGAESRRPTRLSQGAPISGPDPVQGLLEGTVESPLELSLVAEAAGSTTRRLVEHLRSATQTHSSSADVVVVHAIPGRHEHVGVLVTVPRSAGGLAALDENDRTVLHLVVRRVGMAVENARLYAREHRLAETLQRAMLPEQADVRGLDVWTYYAPSSGHAQVGGDWYDVLQLSPGVVTVVIGDVVGHDVEAAAAMGQLRSVVRSCADEAAAPGEVLDRVDHLITGMRIPRSASLVFATLTQGRAPSNGAPVDGAHPDGAPSDGAPSDGAPPDPSARWLLRYSRAGHLPPLVSRAGKVVQLLDGAGAMIGYSQGGRSSGTFQLEPGDVVVLYTDGLIERRDRTLRDGLSALVEVAGGLGSLDAAGVGEELLSRLADSPEDDIAVVVVRVPDPRAVVDPTSTAPRRRRWSLPSEASSIGRARQAVARTSAAWGLDGVPAAELVVSELVANAVLHGWGHVVLRLFDTGEGLRIEVEDANPAPPVTTDGHPGRVGGYGMRIVERLADWGWRPSGSGKLVWARVRPVGSGSGLTSAFGAQG